MMPDITPIRDIPTLWECARCAEDDRQAGRWQRMYDQAVAERNHYRERADKAERLVDALKKCTPDSYVMWYEGEIGDDQLLDP